MSNSEIVRWTEIWLDRAGERGYQSAFVSALAHQGYAVLHNTSHNSLELGKDVVCRSAEGELIAFQLKGNPGGRVTMSQWHGLFQQVMQLVTMPLPQLLTGKRGARHRPILVTNGEIEEDVQAAIGTFNSDLVSQYPHALPLEVWARGRLIQLFAGVAESVWPADLNTQIRLLKSATGTGRDAIPPDDVQDIALNTLHWHEEKASSARSLERIAGLATVISIVTSQQQQIGNLFEAIRAKAIALGIVAGYLCRHGHRSRRHLALFGLMRSELFTLLATYANGIARRFADSPMINENVLDEFAIMHQRRMLVTAMLAVSLPEGESEVALDSRVRDFVLTDVRYRFLTGEAIIPAFLAVFWCKDKSAANYKCDQELMSVLYGLVMSTRAAGMASPYYDIAEVAVRDHKTFLGIMWHRIDQDQRHDRSQFAFALLCLLVRRNWKQTVKQIWPDLTHIIRQETRIDEPNEFAFFRTDNATEHDALMQIPRTWQELVNEVQNALTPELPDLLERDPVLVLLLVVFLPYRCTEAVCLWLDRQLATTWY
jgi:hypothetical protein